jgi:hypothetical protein
VDRQGEADRRAAGIGTVVATAKQLAARDDIQLGALVARMVDLYEKEYGALPESAGKQR